MLDLTVALVIGFVIGGVIGLLPGLPAYLATMIILPFVGDLTVPQILIYWLGSQIGGQYFGSVAAILMRIPGEASSMVYLDDVKHLSLPQKLDLIRQCAFGSTIATLSTVFVLAIIYWAGAAEHVIQLSSINVKVLLLAVLLTFMVLLSEHRITSAIMLGLGLALSEKTNQTFPTWVFEIQHYTTDITVFSLVLGLLIIPAFVEQISRSTSGTHDHGPVKVNALCFQHMFKGTVIGAVIGLIPGPSTILASVFGYNYGGTKSIAKKIIVAESANNSAAISSLMPFFLVGLPITLSEMLLVDMLQMKLFVVPTDFITQGVHTWNMIELAMLAVVIFAMMYHFAAQHFLQFYARFIAALHGQLVWLYLALLVYVVLIDITFNPVTLWRYLLFLVVFTMIGIQMNRRQISPLPLIFGFVLGDTVTWSVYQFYRIYFF